MAWLGRTYLFSIVVGFTLLGWWTLWSLRENPAAVEVIVWLPNLDLAQPLEREHISASVAQLLAGWLVALSLLLLAVVRLPLRLRASARLLRRVRELEREVLELRTLPLRQHDEDEELVHEAQLETRNKRVMTEQLSLVAGQRPRVDATPQAEDTTTTGVSL